MATLDQASHRVLIDTRPSSVIDVVEHPERRSITASTSGGPVFTRHGPQRPYQITKTSHEARSLASNEGSCPRCSMQTYHGRTAPSNFRCALILFSKKGSNLLKNYGKSLVACAAARILHGGSNMFQAGRPRLLLATHPNQVLACLIVDVIHDVAADNHVDCTLDHRRRHNKPL